MRNPRFYASGKRPTVVALWIPKRIIGLCASFSLRVFLAQRVNNATPWLLKTYRMGNWCWLPPASGQAAWRLYDETFQEINSNNMWLWNNRLVVSMQYIQQLCRFIQLFWWHLFPAARYHNPVNFTVVCNCMFWINGMSFKNSHYLKNSKGQLWIPTTP